MSDLTNKQRVFIEEYLQCWNATEAARRAGYEGSENTLGSVGWENLQKPAIARRISERLQAKVMSADEVLSRLSEQARCEYATYIDEDGKVDLAQLKAAGKMYLVKGIKETRYGRQIEFYDGQTALVQVGKHHGLFVDRLEHTGAGGGPIETKEVRLSDAERLAALAAMFEQLPEEAAGSTSDEGDNQSVA